MFSSSIQVFLECYNWAGFMSQVKATQASKFKKFVKCKFSDNTVSHQGGRHYLQSQSSCDRDLSFLSL